MSAPTMDLATRTGRYYVDRLGFALCQIPSGEKGPRAGGWNTPEGAIRTREDVDRAARAEHGWGVVHGLSGTAALDSDMDREYVARALGAVGVDLGALLGAGTPAIIGNPAKPEKPVYRVPDGYALTRRALAWPKQGAPEGREVVFELRAGPVQDVLPPTVHPGTGEPYRWTEVPRSREDFPLIPPSLLGLWLAWDHLRPLMEAACPWAPEAAASASLAHHTREARRPSVDNGPSIIEAWNTRVHPGAVLERNGYKPAGDGRWIAPDSTTGDPGVVLLDGRVYSHHASDALAGPHSHDSFGLLTVLEHGGDPKDAARGAARELGMDAPGRAARIRERLTAGGVR